MITTEIQRLDSQFHAAERLEVAITADSISENGGTSSAAVQRGFLAYSYNTLTPTDPLNVQVNDGVAGSTFSNLAATTNVQGIHSRNASGSFVHVELEQSIRFDPRSRELAAAAIAGAIGGITDSLPSLSVDLTSSDMTEASVPANVTISASEAFSPDFDVTGVDDSALDGTQSVTVNATANGYETGLDTIDVDDDEVGSFVVAESGGSTTTSESGATDSFTVVLGIGPPGNVVIDVTSSDPGEATVDKSSLTFTPSNWDTAQTVTVTGQDDPVVDGDQTTTITLSIDDGNSDDAFDPLADQTVSVTTLDDEIAGFTIAETAGGTSVTEAGSTDTFTVVLDAEPLSAVVLTVTSDDTGKRPSTTRP